MSVRAFAKNRIHKAAWIIHFRKVSRLTGKPSWGQVLGGESGPKISMGLANSRQNLLLQSRGRLAVRGPATEPMNDSSIAVLAHADQHPPHLTVGSFQPLRGRYLRQMLLLHLMQYF